MPIDYQRGKIYKIVNNTDDGICYVGSTTLPLLCQRMAEHRNGYKCLKAGGKINPTSSYTLFDRYGIENCSIELLEIFPCNSKDELTKKEGEYIRSLECVNKIIPNRTKQEWYIDNRDTLLKYQKEHYVVNRDELLKRRKEWYKTNKTIIAEKFKKKYEISKSIIAEKGRNKKHTCVCGLTLRADNKSRHEKSQKHINYCTSVDSLCSIDK